MLLDSKATWKVLREIETERDRQDRKWGEQNHNPGEWLGILIEEIGEVAKAINEAHFSGYARSGKWADYRKEMLEVAAVAVAAVEALDRGKAVPAIRGHKDDD